MQMKGCSAGLIITAVCAVVSCDLIKQFYPSNEQKTWEEAQQYCREHHLDLAFISSQEELDKIRQMSISQPVWIGLYIDEAGEYCWSGGWDSAITFQGFSTYGNTFCVKVWQNNMHPYYCNTPQSFVCFDLNVVVVRENKTWEEALEYCRENYTDLTSLASHAEQLQVQARMNSAGAQTDQAWTGLRFLANEWLWVNGDPLGNLSWTGGSLPECPAPYRHCGTLAKEGELGGTRDCGEKRNFVCFVRG